MSGWKPVSDKTPPDRILDMSLVNQIDDRPDIIIIDWTAPGDDWNQGVGERNKFMYRSMCRRRVGVGAKAGVRVGTEVGTGVWWEHGQWELPLFYPLLPLWSHYPQLFTPNYL